jgi:hypothetical protein
MSADLFYDGFAFLCLMDFREGKEYNDKYGINKHIYYLQYPNAFQVDNIPYTILIAGAIKYFLLSHVKNKIMRPVFWDTVLDQLLSPIFHVDLIKMFKQTDFLKFARQTLNVDLLKD